MHVCTFVIILSTVCAQSFSHVQLFETPWTIAHQAILSMEFSRQEYWSGLPCPPPGDLPNPGIEPRSPTLQVDSLLSEPPGSPRILEWRAYPFFRGSSWPRNWVGFFCIAGGSFISWATREAPTIYQVDYMGKACQAFREAHS